jgi:hypothetical protein
MRKSRIQLRGEVSENRFCLRFCFSEDLADSAGFGRLCNLWDADVGRLWLFDKGRTLSTQPSKFSADRKFRMRSRFTSPSSADAALNLMKRSWDAP